MSRNAVLRDCMMRTVKSKTGCLLYTGTLTDDGYAQTSENGKDLRVSHLILEAYRGPREKGMNALHHCDTPACVNPFHLYWGTLKQNTRDLLRRGRSNHKHSRVVPETVQSIRLRLRAGDATKDIAASFGVTLDTVYRIKNRATWAWLPDPP